MGTVAQQIVDSLYLRSLGNYTRKFMHPILRTTLSVLASYAALVTIIMATFTGIYLITGPGWAYAAPDSWMPSMGWNVMSIIVGFLAAMLGGYIALKIDPRGKAYLILIGAIVILGISEAVVGGMGTVPEPRTIVDPSISDAMNHAVQPVWMYIINPIIGAFGVLAAKRCCR